MKYCNSVWAPYKKSYIDKLDKVQKRATKIIPVLRKMHYPDGLKQLNLPTLTYRRLCVFGGRAIHKADASLLVVYYLDVKMRS